MNRIKAPPIDAIAIARLPVLGIDKLVRLLVRKHRDYLARFTDGDAPRGLGPVNARGGKQAFKRFFDRFVAETKTSIMHWNQSFCAQFNEGPDRFLRVHVNFAASGRVISADWH